MRRAWKETDESSSWERFFRGFLRPFVRPLILLRVSPDTLTALGGALSLVAAALFAAGFVRLAGGLMLLGGLLDVLDGEVARATDRGSEFGAFLDSTLDRFSEAAIFGGVAFFFAASGAPFWSLLAVVALAFSFLTSYTRARAEGLGYECKVGLMERPHRVFLLAALSIAGFVGAGVVLVAVGALVTTLQRILHVRRSSRLDDR